MNLGIILPLVIYLVFIFGAALFAYVKRSKGDFLTRVLCGKSFHDGLCSCDDNGFLLMPVRVLLLVDQGLPINMG